MRIRDPGWRQFGSGMEKSRIRDKHIPDPQHCSQHCRLSGGEDQGGDGQPRQGHRGESLLPFPTRLEAVLKARRQFFNNTVEW